MPVGRCKVRSGRSAIRRRRRSSTKRASAKTEARRFDAHFRVLDAVAVGWVGLGAAGRARSSLTKPVAARIAVNTPSYSVADAATGAIICHRCSGGDDGVDASIGRHGRRRGLRDPKGQLMADTQFTFASMIHRGFLADQNATTEVTVAVPGKPFITRQVPMMTPGDVIGIPSRQVIRCAPVNGVVDAEPNYLATIEFDAPDLPWMFSRKPASGPMQPWITLAVVDVTDLAADPLSASTRRNAVDDRRRTVADPRGGLDVGPRPTPRCRHRAGRSRAVAIPSHQLAEARAESPLPGLRRAGVRGRQGCRARHGSRRRTHEHGLRVGPCSRW